LKELDETDRRGGISSGEVAKIRKLNSNVVVRSGIPLLNVNPTEAIDKYTLALKFFPGNEEAYLERGRAHARAGRPESAIADLQKAVDMGTRRYIAYKNLSDLLVSQNRLDDSIMCWTRLIEREPGNPIAWLERAEVNYKKADTAAALRDANRACELGNKSGCRRAESLKEKRPEMKPRLLRAPHQGCPDANTGSRSGLRKQ
jgi:tetratricopeptide (TPR) repeat protein